MREERESGRVVLKRATTRRAPVWIARRDGERVIAAMLKTKLSLDTLFGKY